MALPDAEGWGRGIHRETKDVNAGKQIKVSLLPSRRCSFVSDTDVTPWRKSFPPQIIVGSNLGVLVAEEKCQRWSWDMLNVESRLTTHHIQNTRYTNMCLPQPIHWKELGKKARVGKNNNVITFHKTFWSDFTQHAWLHFNYGHNYYYYCCFKS